MIGRVEGCAIRVEQSTVTRRHARLYRVEEVWWVEDLGSDNGVYVNGGRIKRSPLVSGDHIACGELLLDYVVE